jgi:hypothetical protein
VRAPIALLVLLLAASCSSDDGGPSQPEAASGSTSSVDIDLDVEPGTAVVEAGGERWVYLVYECLVGADTGSPNRRLALSASATEPFLESDDVLNVDILVGQATGTEEHVITLTRTGVTNLGAADVAMPSRGGPAPDDWIEIDEEAGVVHGRGFELRATDGSGESFADGRLVADCPGV